MYDLDGPVVATAIYERLYSPRSATLDFDSVPHALDAIVTSLREKGLHPSRWAPFIHIGA